MFSSIYLTAALLSTVYSHGAILAVQGTAGSPQGIGFQVDTSIARNCTNISPCQQDTTIIRDAEISANIVNECGRTELTGNIDVGQNTENQLAAGTVTQITKGAALTVTIHQVNADGAGPYACDIDQTGNSAVAFTNATVTNNVPGVNGFSQAQSEDFNITVTMPSNLACTGGSTGNICTVRCRNNALAGPFGGCFAVQQTDTTASVNSANQITTAQTFDDIQNQIAENQIDFPAAVAANQAAGSDAGVQGLAAVNALLAISVTSKASPTQTLAVNNVAAVATSTSEKAAAAASTAKAATGKTGKAKDVAKKRDFELKWAKRIVEDSE